MAQYGSIWHCSFSLNLERWWQKLVVATTSHKMLITFGCPWSRASTALEGLFINFCGYFQTCFSHSKVYKEQMKQQLTHRQAEQRPVFAESIVCECTHLALVQISNFTLQESVSLSFPFFEIANYSLLLSLRHALNFVYWFPLLCNWM